MANRAKTVPKRYVNRFQLLDPSVRVVEAVMDARGRIIGLLPPQQKKPRGRPRNPVPDSVKRSRGRPKTWNYSDLLRFYERGRAALIDEGIKNPTDRQCLERSARGFGLTAQEARQCIKDLSFAQRLSEARAQCGK